MPGQGELGVERADIVTKCFPEQVVDRPQRPGELIPVPVRDKVGPPNAAQPSQNNASLAMARQLRCIWVAGPTAPHAIEGAIWVTPVPMPQGCC
eukprot:11124059-Alexandrium_andersonii.AAC.1